MPQVIADVTLKAGGEYHPPGSRVAIKTSAEADDLVARKAAHYPDADSASGPSEPEPPTESEFPDDFPGADALVAAGIVTFAAVREVEDLTAIKGIGAATAKKIAEALPAEETDDSDGDGDEDDADSDGAGDDDQDDGGAQEPGEPGLDAIED